jgi:hypothetical protein
MTSVSAIPKVKAEPGEFDRIFTNGLKKFRQAAYTAAMKSRLLLIFALLPALQIKLLFAAGTNSVTATDAVPYAPDVLPGNGLAQHPFLYTGEWDHRKTNQTIFVVRDGKVAWTYSIPINDADGTLEELGDATMLSNGNILFCRKVGASEVTPDKKIIWNMDAPKGTEIHSVQPIGLDRVLVTQNSHPPKLMLINIKTGATEKELTLPDLYPEKSPHLQFRRI